MTTEKDVQLPPPKLQFFDENGDPLVGGQVFTYAAGTTNKIVTYTDATGLTPNTNPIILDARGECSVWVPPMTPIDVTGGTVGPAGPQGPPGTGGLPVSVVEYTTADIMSLNTPGTSLPLVPAIGAGLTAIPVAMLFEGIPGAIPFTTVGDFNISYIAGDADSPNAAIPPSMAILTVNSPTQIDYAPLISQTLGHGFESNNGTTTNTDRDALENQPIVLWSLNGGFDDSGDVDMGVRITTWYTIKGQSSTPTTAGVIAISSREYFSLTGTLFTAGAYTLEDAIVAGGGTDVISFDPQTTGVITYEAMSPHRLQFNADCIAELTATVYAKVYPTDVGNPFLARLGISHADGSQFPGTICSSLTGNVGFPPVFMLNVSTGPVSITSGDLWDANFTIYDQGGVYMRALVQQITITATVLALL